MHSERRPRPPIVLIALLAVLVAGTLAFAYRMGVSVLSGMDAAAPAGGAGSAGAFPWAFVIIGGPILLGLLVAWARIRSAKQDRRIDPTTPGDDPGRGM